MGHEIDGGKFFVEDYCYSELPYQPQPDLDLALTKGEDRFINFLNSFFSSYSRVHHYVISEYFSILLGEKARKLAVPAQTILVNMQRYMQMTDLDVLPHMCFCFCGMLWKCIDFSAEDESIWLEKFTMKIERPMKEKLIICYCPITQEAQFLSLFVGILASFKTIFITLLDVKLLLVNFFVGMLHLYPIWASDLRSITNLHFKCL